MKKADFHQQLQRLGISVCVSVHTRARVCVGLCRVQTVEQSKQVQSATLGELQDQGDRLGRVNNKLYQVRGQIAGPVH